MGARLVDAQCPSLARRVRDLAGATAMGHGWQSELLTRLSLIHLIVQEWKRRENLGAEMVAELRAQIGWTIKEEELDGSDAVEDEWWVLGQRGEEEGQIRLIKTFLWGKNSKRPAIFLQFGHASQPLAPQFAPFTRMRANAIFYPGATPLRATFRDKSAAISLADVSFDFATPIAPAAESYAHLLAQNPWLDALPVALKGVALLPTDGAWLVRDGHGDEWPISPLFNRHWEVLAASGGAPITLFGEWNGETLRPFH